MFRFSGENSASIRSYASMMAFLIVLCATTVLQSGCTVRLIGDYDDVIDKGITDLQQKTELYFAQMKSNPNTPYNQAFYDDATARLAVLKTRAASLEKYAIIETQIENLQDAYTSLQKLDRATARPIPPAVVEDADNSITVAVESILKLELALKRGANPKS